jgi:hypothetical protein
VWEDDGNGNKEAGVIWLVPQMRSLSGGGCAITFAARFLCLVGFGLFGALFWMGGGWGSFDWEGWWLKQYCICFEERLVWSTV